MALLLWLLLRESFGLEPAKNLESMTSGDIAHQDVKMQSAAQPSKPVSTPPTAAAFARAEPRLQLPHAEGRVEAVVPANGVPAKLTALAETHSKRSKNACEDDCVTKFPSEAADGLKACKEECHDGAAMTPGTSENFEELKAKSAEAEVKCVKCQQEQMKGELSAECKSMVEACRNFLDNGAVLGAEFEIQKLKKIEDAAQKDMEGGKEGSGAYCFGAGIVVAWGLTL